MNTPVLVFYWTESCRVNSANKGMLVCQMKENPDDEAEYTINAIKNNDISEYALVASLKAKIKDTGEKELLRTAERVFDLFYGWKSFDEKFSLSNPLSKSILQNLDVGHMVMTVGDFIIIQDKVIILKSQGWQIVNRGNCFTKHTADKMSSILI